MGAVMWNVLNKEDQPATQKLPSGLLGWGPSNTAQRQKGWKPV